MSDLTLIIPAKNEKESLPKVLSELQAFDYKINIILDPFKFKLILKTIGANLKNKNKLISN